MGNILEVTDANFDTEIVNAETPSMVDFWAEWCGPCKKVGPVVEELAAEYKGKIKIVKMDVDSNRQTPAKYGIRNIPTLIFFKDGKILDQVVGAVPKAQLKSKIDSLI